MILSRSLPVKLLLLSLAGSAGILACTLTYPFNNDNALYAYMSALLLEGGLPYLGSWDQNFPGVLLVHAPQILLLGRSQIAFHIWDIALQLIGAYYLFRLGLRWGGREAAFLAPIACSFYYVQQGLWMAGERDTYVSILLLAAIFYATDRTALHARWLLTGLLLGLAVLFRPTYGLLILPFALYVTSVSKRVGPLARSIAGTSIPVLGVILIYTSAGGVGHFYDATIRFNTEVYLGQGSVFAFWDPVRFYFPLLPFAIVGVVKLWRREASSALLVLLSLLACVASLLLLYRFSVYHYHPAMTILLLLGVIGLASSIRSMAHIAQSRSFRISVRYLCFIVVVGFFAVQTLRGNTIKTVLSGIVSGRIVSVDDSYTHYEGSPSFGVGIQQSVGKYLSTHAEPGEPVQMFGPYSYPQYYSHTSTASRFQTLHALTMRAEGAELTPMQQEWRKEYLADLQQAKPRFFIVCDAPEAFRQFYGGRLGHEILRDDMIEVGEWLARSYAVDTVIGAFTIYKRSGR